MRLAPDEAAQVLTGTNWSSGYGRRLMFWWSWVWIPAPYTGWTFFTLICCKDCKFVCRKDEKNKKRGRGMAHFGPIRHSLKSFVAHWSQESFPRLKKMRPRPSNYIAWGTTSVLSRTFDRARNFDMVKRDSKWTFVFQEWPQCRKTYFAAKQLP